MEQLNLNPTSSSLLSPIETTTATGTTNDLLNWFGFQSDQQQQGQLASNSWLDQVAQTKLLASLVLFVITLLCGYLPVRCILNQNLVEHAMYAGGGVLMATAFCHLIPETHNNYRFLTNQTQAHHHTHRHDHGHTQPQQQQQQQQQLVNQVNQSITANNLTQLQLINNTLAATETGATTTIVDDFLDTLGDSQVPYPEIVLCCGFFFMFLVEQLMIKFINNHTHAHPCDTVGGGGGGRLEVGQGDQQPVSGKGEFEVVNSNYATTTPGASYGDLSTTIIAPSLRTSISSDNRATEFYKFIRGLLIVSAFGAHAIFDGVAIGSQETVGTVWTIFFAISCHKLIIAAVVGLELFAATLESHTWTLVHLSIFSIMSPIGIILVVVAQESFNIDSNNAVMILLQSFATGTLIYIIFIEILQPKKEQIMREKSRLGKSFSLIIGFALMLIILTFIGHGD